MSKRTIGTVAAILAILMLIAALAGCGGTPKEPTLGNLEDALKGLDSQSPSSANDDVGDEHYEIVDFEDIDVHELHDTFDDAIEGYKNKRIKYTGPINDINYYGYEMDWFYVKFATDVDTESLNKGDTITVVGKLSSKRIGIGGMYLQLIDSYIAE